MNRRRLTWVQGVFRCSLASCALASSALSFSWLATPAGAQTTPAPNTPAPAQPAMPIPAPAPANSLPSMPAAQSPQQPAATPAPAPAPETQNYQDPLRQPIVVAPGAAAPPAAVQMPTPALVGSVPSIPAYSPDPEKPRSDELSSTYIPDDSWVYPAALRLYSLGYLDRAFIAMRPWTRRSLLHMLQNSEADVVADQNQQAMEIFAALKDYLLTEAPAKGMERGRVYGFETVYAQVRGISGTTLRDSYHLGQTFYNDYGRPYAGGFNSYVGASSVNEWGRFSLYVRGEYQHSPAWAGYSYGLANTLACIDYDCPLAGYRVPEDVLPYANTGAQNPFRLMEASLSFHLLGHEISGGKTDSWNSPAVGGAMSWSNNAENIYSFRINRVEPLHIPLFSKLLGPVRYDFFVGSLKGHTDPHAPWVHSETIEVHPTTNFEFGFNRTVVWGGHSPTVDEPVTLHSFLKSFFSFDDTASDPNVKANPGDPGARYSAFNFSWRLPFMNHSVTLYTDSIAHDDVTPPSAPRRAAYRPGLYIAHIPGVPKLDFRVEASSTDTSTLRSLSGQFNYWEVVQHQAYTNKGFIMGDWVGREAKAGNAWLTWHLSANEFVQASYMYKKTPKDFIPNGTTQGQFKIEVVKRLKKDIELDGWLQTERWVAPIYMNGPQHDTTAAFQVTWFPKLKTETTHLNGK